ncbi:polysaccharide biosynthesis protein [Noviherbaspirillum sp.]|uniref:polysaccharide biosynthesis protein n=1 Tax=Noviherbaspirillum sp. TaxID=1926288 RepID=UPI002FE0BD78
MIMNIGRLAATALTLPRPVKRGIVLVVDASLCVLTVWLAYYLRLGYFVPLTGEAALPAFVSVGVALPTFIRSGLYRAIFRYSGLPAMMAVVRALLVYGLVFSAVFTLYGVGGVPRTVGLIQPLLLLLFVGATRAAARIWLGSLYQRQHRRASLSQVLIYGAGVAGRQLASAMANSPEMRVVGFLDDDDRLHGHVLNGLPIYNPADLAEILAEVSVTDVLLALPSVSRQRRNEILADLSPHKVALRTLPGLSDIATGKVSLSDIRELDIDDLLGRDAIRPNGLLLNLSTKGKTVMVTGAGGSIGSELCRQVMRTGPRKLLLVDMSEFALYKVHQELQALLSDARADRSRVTAVAEGDASQFEEVLGTDALESRTAVIEIVPLLASVCDQARMSEIIGTWKPHTVYHAAAYKHVPIVEHNPVEGVRNNVWGTRICAEVAIRHGVRNFVLISTDKAVRPTNIMGATKRLAEMVLQALAAAHSVPARLGSHSVLPLTCFSIVRFGNVLGSSGSVVPLFREQIRNGGPITLTHSEITRYFMTIPEAAQLVIQAGAMAAGGEVFVLDMGQPVRIIDLARRIVELSGLTVKDESRPDGDIEITITGLRPGEKLYEELLIGENPEPTQHPRIMKAQEQFLPWPHLHARLDALSAALAQNDVLLVRALLQELVQGYQTTGAVVDWVHQALERESLQVS